MNQKRSCRIKVGDRVEVITGSNKGTVGSVSAIIFKKSVLFVEGIAPRVKYIKNKEGGESKKIKLDIPIHFSNVMLWDKDTKKSDKVGYRSVKNKKYRYFKKSGSIV